MWYAICIVKRSSITCWTGKNWSANLEEAKLFDNASQAKRKIQNIYQHIEGVASVVAVNPDSPVKLEIRESSGQILDTFSGRIKHLLGRAGLDSDEKVRTCPDYKLWEISGLGEQSFYQIRSKLPFDSDLISK